MRWLWIVGAILLLFVLFCLLPLGIRIRLGSPVYAWVAVGPVRIRVAPSRPGKKKAQKKAAPAKENFLTRLKKLPKPSLEDLKTAYQRLAPPTKKAVRRLCGGIRIYPLQLSVVLGGKDDPAAAAERYGFLNAAVWTGMPLLESAFTVPSPGIHLGVDFDAESTSAQGEIGISLRIGTLLLVGAGLGIPALRWFLQYRKAHAGQPRQGENRHSAVPAA